MKRLLSLILTAAMLFACFALCVEADDGMKDSGIDYTESTEVIKNPHMGYPSHASISMRESGNAVRNDSGFMWYYINISAFSGSNSLLPEGVTWPQDRVDRELSEDALNCIRGTLENLRQNGGSCLIRFVYDWDGQTGREPSSLDTILRHIEQFCGVVGDFADICLGFEAGIIGVFGEMHSSIYCGSASANPIIDAYLDNTPDSMILMVRTPAYVVQYLGLTRAELASYVSPKGSPEYRLSYFNDGYMNSDNDLGTWSNRAQDIAFLSSQTDHATYGGEYGSAYWILPCDACLPENAIPEMYKTHVNFIRGNVYSTRQNEYFGYDSYTYGPEYEEDWYPDNSAFYGTDCHRFIVSHLGYRLVLRDSKLTASPKAGGTLRLTGSIENTGFANVLHFPETQILLVKGGYTYVCDVSVDASHIKSCTVQDYDLTLNLPASMPAGDYTVYMRMAASTQTFFTSAKSGIAFANKESLFNSTLGANYIGEVTVGAADTALSPMADTFCEIGDNCIPGGLTTEGAPLLFGMGLPASGSLVLNYHTGDTATLSAAHMLRADATVNYTWYKDGAVVGNEASLVIEDLDSSDVGVYKLTVKSEGQTQSTANVKINVDSHTFSDFETVKEPTCHTPGEKERTCADCSLTETGFIPTVSHTAADPVTVDSTCTVRGTITTDCKDCGDELDIEVLDLLPHDCTEEVTEPTCVTNGKTVYDCKHCDYTLVEAIDALGHDYVYTVTGNTASAVCSRCKTPRDSEVFDGDLGSGMSAEEFDGTLTGPVLVDSTPLVLIGEDGYITSYESDNAGYVTFLFEVKGVSDPIKMGKFRTLSYPKGQPNNIFDSNNAGNYYGSLLFEVNEDGLWALSIRKYLMCPAGNGGYGGITWAAFNDLDSTKGKEPVNGNPDATFELKGVYDSLLDYNVLFMDEDGNFVSHSEGSYNASINWSNLITRVEDVDDLYTGDTPTKRATLDTVYTFAGWVDAQGQAVPYALGNMIVYPSFTETENTCEHDSVTEDVIKEPTCTEPGLSGDVCGDCGVSMGETYEVDATGHQSESPRVTKNATFREKGEQEVYCADCLTYLRTEEVPVLVNNYSDVDINKWYSDAVAYVTSNGIFNGTSATTFAPEANVTRGMFVTVLGRMVDVPDNREVSTVFEDVEVGRYYTGYVAWANKAGIVNGRSDTVFAPDASITREEMCVMIKRFCEYEQITLKRDTGVLDNFADFTRISKWAIDSIDICRRAYLVQGKGVNEAGIPFFDPKGTATRAEVATILYRLKTTYMQ